MALKSNSVRDALDAVTSSRKVTGVAANIEIVAYPDGHAAIVGHPLNGEEALLESVSYLFERLHREARATPRHA